MVAYGALVPPAALDVPAHGWVNLHFSLLPAWRGAAPVQRALMAGDEVTGATTFRLEEGLDTGPVFGVLTEPIRPTTPPATCSTGCRVAGAALLVATLDAHRGRHRSSPSPQPAEGVSPGARRSTVDDARVDWALPALRRRPAGPRLHPGPGCLDDAAAAQRLRLGPVTRRPRRRPGSRRASCMAGKGACSSARRRAAVGSARCSPQGKRPMAAADWARGARLGPGERLES